MNKLSGHISEVKVNGALSQVTVAISKSSQLKAIVIESPETATYLQIANPVSVIFKETEVILAKHDQKLSLLNKIKGEVRQIKKGVLLSEVGLSTEAGPVRAIISTEALDELDLKISEKVIALVKQNEIMLAE